MEENNTKNKKTGLIVGIVAGVLVLASIGVGAFLYLSRPMHKIEKAIEVTDTETVSDLYSELKSEDDMALVKEEMLKLSEDTYNDYLDEKISYDDAMDILDPLEDDVLADDEDFLKILSDMKDIKDSRDAFEKAEEAFLKEDYESAYEKYLMVIEKDTKNFEEAAKKIELCLEEINKGPSGMYEGSVSLDTMIEEFVSSYGFDISIPDILFVSIYAEFNEDGTGSLYVDEDDVKNITETLIPYIKDSFLDKYLAEIGISEDSLDMLVTLGGYTSIDEFLEDKMDSLVDEGFKLMGIYDICNKDTNTFTYEVIDGALTINGDTEVDYELSEGTLTLGSMGSVTRSLEELGVAFPITLESVS